MALLLSRGLPSIHANCRNELQTHGNGGVKHAPPVRVNFQLGQSGIDLGKNRGVTVVGDGVFGVVDVQTFSDRLPRSRAQRQPNRKHSEADERIVCCEVSEHADLEEHELRYPSVVVVVDFEFQPSLLVAQTATSDSCLDPRGINLSFRPSCGHSCHSTYIHLGLDLPAFGRMFRSRIEPNDLRLIRPDASDVDLSVPLICGSEDIFRKRFRR